MGFLSSIGDAISGVTKPLKNFLSDSGVGDVLGFGSDLYGMYNDVTGNSAKVQKDLMAYQSQLQRENWQYQMSNRHQLEVGDLRNAGLNPILSANSAGSISAGIPNGALADSDSARHNARSSAALARQNAAQVESLIRTNASQINLNDANARAVLKNADANFLRAQADAGLSLQRTQNERLYPANQPLPFRYLNSAAGLKDSIENFFDRRYGPPSNATADRRRRYEVFINGTSKTRH